LEGLPHLVNPNVLLGFETSDDAGVYKLSEECALVQTVDFFTPIVDDPYTYGAIAAANSLSDVYAMGGKPVTALSVLGYPAGGEMEVLRAILAGGADKVLEAECALLGGHSVADEEIKFGYAVTGTVHPGRYRANGHARVGDVIVLTKPLGTGVLATAVKRGLGFAAEIAAATQWMLQLNRDACLAMQRLEARGCTDITGFGLAGHGREMAEASGVTLEISAGALPLLDGALAAVEAGAVPGGLKNNRSHNEGRVRVGAGVPDLLAMLAFDPQTSGGLCITMPEADARRLMEEVPAWMIGNVIERREEAIWLVA
jgi:selenide,water dikinase